MGGRRVQMGERFISDTALMMLALACYILGALFELTNLYAPSNMAKRIGLWGATLGVFFNFSSWLVRWANAYDHELAQLQQSGNMVKPWIFRYVPFANLYDLSIAFAFGAGITTLVGNVRITQGMPRERLVRTPRLFGESGWDVDGTIVNHDTWSTQQRLNGLHWSGVLDLLPGDNATRPAQLEQHVSGRGVSLRTKGGVALAPADFERVLAVNLFGPLRLIQAVLPQMRARQPS